MSERVSEFHTWDSFTFTLPLNILAMKKYIFKYILFTGQYKWQQ